MKKFSIGEFDILRRFLALENRGDFSVIEYLNTCNFDVSGEINISDGTFIVTNDLPDKYITPVSQGPYKDFFEYGKEHVVHPDDVKEYDAIMNPKTLLQSLKNSKTPNIRALQTRLKLKDGSYHAILNFLVTGRENVLEDNIVKFYIFDVNNILNRINGVRHEKDISVSQEIRDPLTNLFYRNYFEKNVNELTKKLPNQKWCLISIDIEHFSLFDEWYGREKGRYVLSNIGNTLNDFSKKYNGVGGYFGHDDFMILIPYSTETINKLYEAIKNDVAAFKLSKGFLPAFGICLWKDGTDLDDVVDKAEIAAYKAKSDIKNRIHIYDPNDQIKAEKEYLTLMETMEALSKKEITFHLQPQCRISSKKVVGGEALARWIKPDGTIIYPNDFIPVLEKYGFIVDLDTYIWERVCAWIREQLDLGANIVPISINVSQVDILTIDVASFLIDLTEKYNIPHGLIKVEITESAYADIATAVSDLVKKLRDNGFLVLMDDFGSGYSSLNMLSNLKIDVIKLDALFLRFGNADDKAIKILESVVSMAKQIGIPIIVEGVETKQQCDFLQGLGCRYVQGYYFYKPIEIEEFEKLISDTNNVDNRGFIAKNNEQFRIRDFLDENVYSDAMLNEILGPVAIYHLHKDSVDIVRYNQQFYESVGSAEFAERLDHIEKYIYKKDRKVMFDLLKEALNNNLNGSRGTLRFYREDGFLTTYDMHFYYIGDREGEPLFYGSANNVSKMANQEEYIKYITEYSNATYLFIRKSGNKYIYDVAVYSLENVLGFTSEEIEEKLNNGLMRQNVKNYDQIFNSLKDNPKETELYINFVSKKGNIVTLEIKIRPVKGDTNIVYSIQASIY